MRAQGLLRHTTGLEDADHVCWVYDDPGGFRAAATRYLADGLARGQRLLCVGDLGLDDLRRDPGPLAEADRLLERGDLQVLSVSEAYDPDGAFVPERQLEFYDGMTRQAVADGYRGLRVVAEVTALAQDDRRRPELVRWEHLADHYVTRGPGMSAMCAYSGDRLTDGATADVAAVHPMVHAAQRTSPFRLFVEERSLVLAGEVDTLSADRLRRTLAVAHLPEPDVELDLGRLEFIDLAGCRVLGEWAGTLQHRSARLALRGAPRLLRRMWQLVGFGDLVEVSFPGPRA